MAKCSKCGKKGLFLRLSNGLCDECCAAKLNQLPSLFSSSSPAINNVDLAEKVMESLLLSSEVHSGGKISTGDRYSREVKAIHDRYQRQGAIAAHASALCGNPTTAKGYCIKSWACEWAGAKYRAETIKWTLKWIETGLSYPGMDPWHYTGCTAKQSREYKAYDRLGKAFEGEYMFEDALSSYKKAYEARPDAYHLVVNMSNVLTKMNRLDDAIELVSTAPCNDPCSKNIRRDTIKELKEKKARGYVYKPRKKPAADKSLEGCK